MVLQFQHYIGYNKLDLVLIALISRGLQASIFLGNVRSLIFPTGHLRVFVASGRAPVPAHSRFNSLALMTSRSTVFHASNYPYMTVY